LIVKDLFDPGLTPFCLLNWKKNQQILVAFYKMHSHLLWKMLEYAKLDMWPYVHYENTHNPKFIWQKYLSLMWCIYHFLKRSFIELNVTTGWKSTSTNISPSVSQLFLISFKVIHNYISYMRLFIVTVIYSLLWIRSIQTIHNIFYISLNIYLGGG
jgi:hypothetical protein